MVYRFKTVWLIDVKNNLGFGIYLENGESVYAFSMSEILQATNNLPKNESTIYLKPPNANIRPASNTNIPPIEQSQFITERTTQLTIK